jgi:hypothetical protein
MEEERAASLQQPRGVTAEEVAVYQRSQAVRKEAEKKIIDDDRKDFLHVQHLPAPAKVLRQVELYHDQQLRRDEDIAEALRSISKMERGMTAAVRSPSK